MGKAWYKSRIEKLRQDRIEAWERFREKSKILDAAMREYDSALKEAEIIEGFVKDFEKLIAEKD